MTFIFFLQYFHLLFLPRQPFIVYPYLRHMKYLLFCLLLWPLLGVAQAKYDANWVFGKGCGINFQNASAPFSFYSNANHTEPNASISDSAGNLQLYLSYTMYTWMQGSIRDATNDTIINGEGIKIHSSATNGAVFVPIPGTKDSIYLFHIDEYSQTCDYDRCYRLYHTLIVRNSFGKWEARQKNIPLFLPIVEESIALVRKANGIDWWLLVQKQRSNVSPGGIFYLFNVGKSITFSDSVFVNDHNAIYSYVGELVFNSAGNLLMDIVPQDNKVFLSRFNRCNGSISKLDSIDFVSLTSSVYSGCIIEPYIYIAVVENNTATGIEIYRAQIYADSISPLVLFHKENVPDLQTSQIEKGPDGNIWVSCRYMGFDSILKRKFQKHLSIIKNPERDTARFVTNYLFMGDSASVHLGLPNFPNYNLGPSDVFPATAGEDTVTCLNSGGVTIGTAAVTHITYSWQPTQGLNATNIAQPTANPTQSTWYYLTATDGCGVHTDSVYVKVSACTGLDEIAAVNARIYPNPTTGQLTIQLFSPVLNANFQLYNLLGQRVAEVVLTATETSVDLSLINKGIYGYRIVHNGTLETGKLVLE